MSNKNKKDPRGSHTKRVDGELYLNRETKVFFDDQEIPEKYKDATRYALVIIKRPKK